MEPEVSSPLPHFTALCAVFYVTLVMATLENKRWLYKYYSGLPELKYTY